MPANFILSFDEDGGTKEVDRKQESVRCCQVGGSSMQRCLRTHDLNWNHICCACAHLPFSIGGVLQSGPQVDRSAVRPAADEDTHYCGVSAPSHVQQSSLMFESITSQCCSTMLQVDRSAVRQAADEDTHYRGVSAPSRNKVQEEPVVTVMPMVSKLIFHGCDARWVADVGEEASAPHEE